MLTRRNQAIFFDLTALFVIVSLADIFAGVFAYQVRIVIYACAATCFLASCTLWVRTVWRLFQLVLLPFALRDQRIQALQKDYRLLTVVLSLPGLGMGGRHYPGALIYAAAAYTFYKLIMSAISLARAQREKSPLAMALRCIGHSESLVSLLSLQTAMFAEFGSAPDNFAPMMNLVTGGIVCLAALVIGVSMVWKGSQGTHSLRG